jgi:hypothetical protein
MEDDARLLDSLLERASEYGKTSLEIVKLKALDRTAELISASVPLAIVIILIASFLLFINLGLAFWFGEMLGRTYYGFFVVSAFYIIVCLIVRFFLYNRIKKLVGNYFIKIVLK